MPPKTIRRHCFTQKKSIEYYCKGDNLSNVANAYNAAALIHAEIRNFDSVGIYMNKALEIGTQLGDTMLLALETRWVTP